MPRMYEEIRDQLISSGKPEKAAKAEAAATYFKRTGHTVQADAKKMGEAPKHRGKK